MMMTMTKKTKMMSWRLLDIAEVWLDIKTDMSTPIAIHRTAVTTIISASSSTTTQSFPRFVTARVELNVLRLHN